jgi:hypothetical protein
MGAIHHDDGHDHRQEAFGIRKSTLQLKSAAQPDAPT